MGTIDLTWISKKGGRALRKQRGHERIQEGEFLTRSKEKLHTKCEMGTCKAVRFSQNKPSRG